MRQHHNEHVTDFGPIGGAVRSPKVQMHNMKESEPLLLAQSAKMRQIKEQQEHRSPKHEEKLTSLNSQLYQQTEKLRQWMINTEIQMSEKDRKLEDSTKTIDSLRKSILELQFLNESVSSKLHDEKTLQEETIQKIATTRNMCNALKEHLVKLENGVVMGENMLDAQRLETKQKEDQFQELALRFQELEIRVNSKEHDMQKAIKISQEEYMRESERLQNKLRESNECMTRLKEMNLKYDNEIKIKNKQIASVEEECNKMKKEYVILERQLEAANDVIKEHANTIKQVHADNDKVTREAEELERSQGVKISELENICKDKDEEIRTMINDVAVKNVEVSELKHEISTLSENLDAKVLEMEEAAGKLDEMTELIGKFEADILSKSKTVGELERELQDKETVLEEYKEKEDENCKLIELKETVTDELRKEMTSLQVELEKAKGNEVEVSNLKAKLKDVEAMKEELQFQANFALSQIEELTSQLQKLTESKQVLESEIKKAKLELEGYQQREDESTTTLKEMEDQIKQQQAELESANEEAQQLKAQLEELSHQKEENAETLNEIMGSRDKKIENTEKKVQTLQAKVSAKVKQITKFQADIKALRGQLKGQEKANKKLGDELEMAQSTIEKLNSDKGVLFEEVNGKEKGLLEELEKWQSISAKHEKENEELVAEMEQLQKEAKLSCKNSDGAKQELNQAKQSFDAQIAEMCKTLEKYKMENEKLMSAKEKELDEKTRSAFEAKNLLEERLGEKDVEIKNLNESISDKDKNITKLSNDIKKMISKICALEKELEEAQEKSDVDMVEDEEKVMAATIIKQAKKELVSPKALTPKLPKTPKTPQFSTPSSIPKGKLDLKYLCPTLITANHQNRS